MAAVRWYLRYCLSYRDVEELLVEHGVEVDDVTAYRWVQRFTPLLSDAARFARDASGDRWFVDETYVKVNGVWRYVYPRERLRRIARDVGVNVAGNLITAAVLYLAAVIGGYVRANPGIILLSAGSVLFGVSGFLAGLFPGPPEVRKSNQRSDSRSLARELLSLAQIQIVLSRCLSWL